jgi:chromosome segregation ATPase
MAEAAERSLEELRADLARLRAERAGAEEETRRWTETVRSLRTAEAEARETARVAEIRLDAAEEETADARVALSGAKEWEETVAEELVETAALLRRALLREDGLL